ncbi:MAG: amino-acid N-acetyltransferase [Gammaproteobacteria bacterium]|nr:MAG: amino-acid N-acetyltransferase [Gammaproteobacteria bacterium]
MPKDSTFQLESFRQATPYIYAHRSKTFVLYISDALLAKDNRASLIHDLALVHTLGVKLILVLGLRTFIDKKLGKQSASSFENNWRITNAKTLDTIKEVAGCVKTDIEALFSIGLVNTPMSGMKLNVVSGNYVRAKPVGVRNGTDYQHTGEVRSIAAEEIQKQLDANNIVLMLPLGYSKTGDVFNLTSMEVAKHAACALQSEKLILMLDKFSVPGKKKQSDNHFNVNEAKELAKKLPNTKQLLKDYLGIAVQACLENVKRVHLLDASKPGALLEELYTLDGVATLVTAETYDEIRPATINDVGGITELIQPLIDKGALVSRTREQLELEIESFDVIERDGMVLACGALQIYAQESAAEVACLAVHPEYQSNGRGSKMLTHLEKKSTAAGVNLLFVLTTQTSHWFREHGFKTSKIESLPMKKRALYNYQRNSKAYSKAV